MAESEAHKRAKRKAAGKQGQTEKPLPGRQRLDAESASGIATEIERSENLLSLRKAARRLKKSHSLKKVLMVPQHNMELAVEAMKKEDVAGTVSNISRSKKRRVR